jgi:hypothetical protein
MGAPGRTASAGRRPLVGVPQRSRRPPARGQPLAPPSASSSSTASLRANLPPLAPVHGVAPSPARRIASPGAGPCPPRRTQLLQPWRATVAGPDARGDGRGSLWASAAPRPARSIPARLAGPPPDGRGAAHTGPAGCRPGAQPPAWPSPGLPRCTLLAGQPIGGPKEGLGAHGEPVVAHQRGRAVCLWRKALAWHGDGC